MAREEAGTNGPGLALTYEYFVEAEHPELTEVQKLQVLRWIALHVERNLRFEEV